MSAVARQIKAEPLTAEGFARFGQVIECAGHSSYAINAGSSQRFTDLAQLACDPDGRLALSIFRAEHQPIPCPLHSLERHPLGTQAFMPLAGQGFIVVVAEQPVADRLHVFLSNGRQGINFSRGVWHHPLLTLASGDFLVADRIGPDNNCEAVDIRDWHLQVAL